MPRIPIIESQVATPLGAPRMDRADAPNMLGGLAEGLQRGASALWARQQRDDAETERRLQEEAAVQVAAAREQERDEATVYVSNAISSGRADWAERLSRAREASVEDAPGFTASAMTDFDKWAKEQVDAAPAAAKKALQMQLNTLRTAIHQNSWEFETTARYKKLGKDFDAGLDADRRTVWADPAQFTEVLARRMAAARALGLPEAVRRDLETKAREALAFDAAMGRAERDPEGVAKVLGFGGRQVGPKGKTRAAPGAAATIDSDPVFSMLAPERLQAVLHRAQALVAQKAAFQAAQAAVWQSAVREQAREVIADLRTGWAPPADVLANTLRAVKGTPLEDSVRQAMQLSDVEQQARSMPLPQLRAEMTRMRASGDARYRDTYERLEKVEQDADRRLREDGFAYGARVLGIQPPAIDWSNPEAGLSARVSAARLIQKQVGQPVSPLMADESAQYAKLLAALPAEQQAQRIAALSAVVPPDQIQVLAKQIDPKDRALSLAMKAGTARTSRNRFTSELILVGRAIAADAKQSVTARGDAQRQQLREQIIAELDGGERGMATVHGTARQDIIDAALYINDGLSAFGSDAGARAAVRLAVGGDMIEHNGQRLPIPAGYGVDGFRDVLAKYPLDSIARQTSDGQVYAMGAQPMSAQELLASLPTAKLDPIGYGRYHVRLGAGIAVNNKGQAIVVEVR